MQPPSGFALGFGAGLALEPEGHARALGGLDLEPVLAEILLAAAAMA